VTAQSHVGSDPMLFRVRELLRQGAVQDADVLVNAVLARAPTDADALYLRGVIANRRRDHGAAIAALRQAIAVRPDMALAWLALGNAYLRLEQFGAAAEAYRAVLAREPGWADAHFNLGLVRKRQGERLAAARALHAAWLLDPMMFEAAKQCVATIADCVRHGEAWAAPVSIHDDPVRKAFTIVLCSIDDAKHDRVVALYRRLFAGIAHEIVSIRNARSLAEAYNDAIANSTGDIVVLSHDDIDVLATDFAARLSRQLRDFDAVGVVGSTRMGGPAVGWSGHPFLRGWITHHASADAAWSVDLLDPRGAADDIAILDGVLLAARREVFAAVPFDAETFDGFHLYDIDWSYRASRAGFRLGVASELLVVHASRGAYDAAWQRYADRFCAKYNAGSTPPATSSFFGSSLDSADQVRAFYALLTALSIGDRPR
jgi:tetratricopeptide (TPR) repeat protein